MVIIKPGRPKQKIIVAFTVMDYFERYQVIKTSNIPTCEFDWNYRMCRDMKI